MRRSVWSLIILNFLCFVSISAYSFAQSASQPRKFSAFINGGIDIFSGEFSFTTTDVSVGSDSFPSRLDLVRRYNLFNPASEFTESFAQGYGHNFEIYAICAPCNVQGYETRLKIGLFGQTFDFIKVGGAWENWYDDGAAAVELPNGGLQLTNKEGMQVIFAPSYSGSSLGCGTNCRVATFVKAANGDSIVLSYDSLPTGTWPYSRLNSVVNSRGYGISFTYLNSALSGAIQESRIISGAAAYRVSCSDGIVDCTKGVLATVSYGYTVMQTGQSGYKRYRLTSFTDANGKVSQYEYGGPEFRLSVIRTAPSLATPLISLQYYNAPDGNVYLPNWKVRTQTDAFGTATYDFAPAGYSQSSTRIVQDVTGGVKRFEFTARTDVYDGRARHSLPSKIINEAGHQSMYTYSETGKVVFSQDPEGNGIEKNYDGRGNIISETIHAKTGSGSGQAIAFSSYPDCTEFNFRTCNKPDYTVDRNGGRTDYQYDDDSAGVKVILMPADENGFRAITRFTYSAFYPAPGVAAPAGLTLTPVWLLTRKDECKVSGVIGTAIDFNYTCPTSQTIRTEYNFTPSTGSARTSFELENVTEDALGNARITNYRYDKVGNKIGEIRTPS